MPVEAPRNRETSVTETRNFGRLLEARQISVDSLLCVGLDPNWETIFDSTKEKFDDIKKIITPELFHDPENFYKARVVKEWFKEVVDQTKDYVCAYKPNAAFFESLGSHGWETLKQGIKYIHETEPTIPVIVDAKRGDIGNTTEAYAKGIFDYLEADAITTNPYLGSDSLEPYLKRTDKGVIVLCKTSNPGSDEIQNLDVDHKELGRVKVYEVVAHNMEKLNREHGNISLVVGATYPTELARIRQIFSGNILIPGLGSQGGKPEDIAAALREDGRGIVANVARKVLEAQDRTTEARNWRDAINVVRKAA